MMHRRLSTLSFGFELSMRGLPTMCTAQADFSRHVARGPRAKTVCPTSRPALGGFAKRAFITKLSVSTFENRSVARGCTTVHVVVGSQGRAGQGRGAHRWVDYTSDRIFLEQQKKFSFGCAGNYSRHPFLERKHGFDMMLLVLPCLPTWESSLEEHPFQEIRCQVKVFNFPKRIHLEGLMR